MQIGDEILPSQFEKDADFFEHAEFEYSVSTADIVEMHITNDPQSLLGEHGAIWPIAHFENGLIRLESAYGHGNPVKEDYILALKVRLYSFGQWEEVGGTGGGGESLGLSLKTYNGGRLKIEVEDAEAYLYYIDEYGNRALIDHFNDEQKAMNLAHKLAHQLTYTHSRDKVE